MRLAAIRLLEQLEYGLRHGGRGLADGEQADWRVTLEFAGAVQGLAHEGGRLCGSDRGAEDRFGVHPAAHVRALRSCTRSSRSRYAAVS
jgi:hypothetical protein